MFLIFVGATTLFHLAWRRVPQAFDYALMVLNASSYLGLSYLVMWDELRDWMGAFTLGLALFYGLLAWLFMLRSKDYPYLSLISLGIGIVLLTIAAPVQMGGPWLSVAWAAEGAVLVWLSFALRTWQMRPAGATAFALSVLWLLANLPDTLELDLTPLVNAHMLSHAIVIVVLYAAAWLVRPRQSRPGEMGLRAVPGAARRGHRRPDGAGAGAARGLVGRSRVVRRGPRPGLAVIPARPLRATAAGPGRVRRPRAVASLAVETWTDLYPYTTLLNYRVMAFASGIASLYLAAVIMWKHRSDADILDTTHVVGGLLLAANFLTLWILSAEVVSTVDEVVVDADDDTAFYTKSLGLSLVWALYASVGLVLGVIQGMEDRPTSQPRTARAPHRQALPVRLLRARQGVPGRRVPDPRRAAARRRPALPALRRGDTRVPLRGANGRAPAARTLPIRRTA